MVLTSTLATVQFTSAGMRPQDVTTVSQNLLRDGWDSSEPGLSPTTVSGGGFGQLFAAHVDGQVYAQPLVIDTPGTATTAPASSVIAVTENDSVYSLNATTGAVQWHTQVGTPWLSSAAGCNDVNPLIGITSTPVYDPSAQTVYTVAVTTGGNESTKTPTISLYALNEQTGAVKWSKTVGGAATNASKQKFNPALERQRTGLLLLNGWLYWGYSSYCDHGNYLGFVSGVHTTDHSQTLWAAETGSATDQGGIWHAGGGLMSDGPGRIFLTTGNGVSPPPGPGTPAPSELGDSVIRLNVHSDGTLGAGDFFSPANAPTLDRDDADFGSGGPVGLPFGTSTHPGLLLQAGKDGRLFLLDSHALGGRSATTDHPVSMTGPFGGQWGHPGAFAGSGGNDYVYYVGENDYMRILKFDGSNPAKPVLRLVANSTEAFGYSSGSPVVTSNGTDPATALVWVVHTVGSNATNARLEAYPAVPQAGRATVNPIWSAPVGQSAKFAVAATDSGRVYTGSRNDGTDATRGVVYGFGVTKAMPLLAKPIDFGAVGVSGPAKTLTATLTATQGLQVAGITGTSSTDPSPLTLGSPSVNGAPVAGFPVSLTAGQRLTVPVTFTPTATGSVTGSVDVATNVPGFATVSVPLTGAGAAPGLAASPTSLAFGSNGTGISFDLNNGPVPVGSSQTFTTNIVNTGTTADIVSSVTPPAAPFSMTGLAQGTVLQPGQAVPVTVTYKPTRVTSADAGSLTVTDSGGSVTVPLTGVSVAGSGTLTASRTSVAFSNVALGKSVSTDVTLTNTGNLPLTVTGFTAPLAPFGAPVPPSAGLSINPGDDITVPVSFTPQSKGTFIGQYTLTTTDGVNPAKTIRIPFSGVAIARPSGVVVPGPGGGWVTNGSAAMFGTTLVLTPALTNHAGSAIYNQARPSNGMRATFTARLSGGTGADGLTFALINPADTASALGGAGPLLGFGGMRGVAVVLGTRKDAGFPAANFVGFSTGTTAGHLIINRYSTAVPNLRTGTHRIGVAVSGQTITVTVDGKQAVKATFPTLATSVMPAFTAATGTGTDVHAVSGVSLSAVTGPLPPPGGGWSFNVASQHGSDTLLTHATANARATVIYPRAISTANVSATFNVQIGGGTGGNGMAFALLTPTTKVNAIGSAGSGAGLAGLSGLVVELVTNQAAGDPSNNFVAITYGTSGQPAIRGASGAIPPLRNGTHTITVTVVARVVTVFVDGNKTITRTITGLPSKMLPAFTAATGAMTDNHLIRNAIITATGF